MEIYVQEKTRKNKAYDQCHFLGPLTYDIKLLPGGWEGPCAVSGCEASGVMEAEVGQQKNVLVLLSCLCGHRQTGAAQALRCRVEGECPLVQAQKDYGTAS